MVRDSSLDPTKLKKANTGRGAIYSVADIVECLDGNEMKTGELKKKCEEEKGMSSGTFFSLLKRGASEGKLNKSKITQAWSALQ